MNNQIHAILDELKAHTEHLLGEIAQDAERPVLQQEALGIFQKVIELKKELELLEMGARSAEPAMPKSGREVTDSARDVAEEINKIRRKLPKWAHNQQQINSKILTKYLALRRAGHDQITEPEFARAYGNESEFYRNYPQMKTVSPRNHGKVFDVQNGYVQIWEPVADAVARYESTVFGDQQ